MMKRYFLFVACLCTVAGLRAQDLPESYIQFERMAQSLVEPLVPLMEEGKSKLDLAGPPSDHGLMADLLEAYTRPSLLVALWLQMEPLPEEVGEDGPNREEVAKWFREALVMGTDPEHPEYWGHLTNYHQHGVEMAILTIALDAAHEYLWDPLSKEEQDQVAAWLGQIRGNARYWNNHMYFSVLTLEFLRAYGYEEPSDLPTIDYLFDQLEYMHQGGGWFMDGTNESFDHYNAYAFHSYGLFWAHRYGAYNPERQERWRDWARLFIDDYARLFAADGQHLPFGRSITYRFNSLGVFGLAALNDLDAIPLGEMRRLCRMNLEFFLSHPIEQEQGALSVGWVDEFHDIAEPYTCAGSPYWASKGLFMLMLPPDHEFWTAEEQPIPAEEGDFVRVIEAPGMVFRGVDGEVEMINAGTRCSRSAERRYGAWKWSKISYRTGMGFLTTPDNDIYPVDAAVTAESPGDKSARWGRHPTIPVEVTEDYLSYSYALGDRDSYFNVPMETLVFWKEGWLLVVHKLDAFQPSVIKQGTYALGSDKAEFSYDSREFPHAQVSSDDKSVAIQNLKGFDHVYFDERTSDAGERRHLVGDYHVAPYLATKALEGVHTLAALYWAGTEKEQGQPWAVESSTEGAWVLSHPIMGEWQIEHPELPQL